MWDCGSHRLRRHARRRLGDGGDGVARLAVGLERQELGGAEDEDEVGDGVEGGEDVHEVEQAVAEGALVEVEVGEPRVAVEAEAGRRAVVAGTLHG